MIRSHFVRFFIFDMLKLKLTCEKVISIECSTIISYVENEKFKQLYMADFSNLIFTSREFCRGENNVL